MESWRYVSGENGFLSEEISVSGDGSKHYSLAWDPRNPYSFSNLFSTHQQFQNQGFGGLGSLEMVRKQELDSSIFDGLSSKAENGRIMNPLTSSSKLSVSVAESNSRDSSLIDLKLGRFADQWDAHCNKFSKENQLFSSSESSTPKRVRASPGNSQPAFCQVLGCNKDLSFSKDYHKRHKVCDIHSKTAKVIVNGIEQRFCQQCSRFHLLDAFDDGKRSCRKRLAGHNERRRKPQIGINSGRSGRLLPSSYNGIGGSRFLGGGTSFTCQEILSNGLFHPDKYISNEWGRPIKVEAKHNHPLSTIPAIEGHLHSKSFFSPCDIETQFMPFAYGGTIFNEPGSHYPSIGALNSSSHSTCHNASMGNNDDFDVFCAASAVRSNTGCARSLLSAQYRNSSSHSSGIPMARPWLMPNGETHYNVNQVSEKLMGVSSTIGVSNKISSSSAEGCQLGPILTSDSSDTVNFEIVDGIFHGLSDGKDQLSSESGPTMNLLQLSSQLQRVEHQRKSMHLKQENNAGCCL